MIWVFLQRNRDYGQPFRKTNGHNHIRTAMQSSLTLAGNLSAGPPKFFFCGLNMPGD